MSDRVTYIINIANLAHSYGFVPIPLRDKIPITKGWPKLRNDPIEDAHDASLGKLPKNVRRVQHLAETKINPANNVGIVTGEASGVVVFDIDTINNGVQIWNETVKLNGALPETFIVQTPTGGFHYYFRYTPDLARLDNINRIMNIPVDYRTNNGMAVFPGSIDKLGLEYKVLSGYVDNRPIIAEIPTWLKVFLIMDRIMKVNKIVPTPENISQKALELNITL